ncbi:MAG: TonB-dependent receptor [Paludibacteraceae bacterium]|nr:TonB-dependent receptor [Paludibacteraceae bacterium]
MRTTRLILTNILLTTLFFLHADVRGVVLDEKGETIVGANVVWKGTSKGASTDLDGRFSLAVDESTDTLIVSYVSYKNDTLIARDGEDLTIRLSGAVQLSNVDVAAKKVSLTKSRVSVFDTQTISGEELCKAACCNLAESFETNPSVDVAYSDAATGAKQIRLLGLSGQYVQIMTENIPNFRGISAPFGLNYIPGPWMESIQVSKGTSSVLNGYEALTGQINVEYKKPISEEKVAANVFVSSAARAEINANAAFTVNPYVSTGFLLHASDEFVEWDHNKDGFLDMPRVAQYNLIDRWYIKKGAYTGQIFARGLYETRKGGQIRTMENPYHVDIQTGRAELFMKNGYVFDPENGTSIGIITNATFHNQQSVYGHKEYNATQWNAYLNAIFQTSWTDMHKLSTGLSFNYDHYNEHLFANVINDTIRNEFVPGIFAEYTFNWNNKLILLGGLRADYHSTYGAFVTPRVNIKYNPWDFLHLRASVGMGHRAPNVLAENNNLLSSSRQLVIEDNLKMERAWNYGLSLTGYIPIAGRELTLSAECYYTDFLNQTVVDMDADPHKVLFYNLDGRSYALSAQAEATMEVFKGFTATLAYRYTDVKCTYQGVLREKPLTNRFKGLVTISYQTPLKKWQFDFTAQFNGGGRLPDSYDVVDVDGNMTKKWNETFKPYTILNAQITKYFRTWSIYAGAENMTNFTQKNPIIDVTDPFGDNFDATMIWGPVHGYKVYVGMRWALTDWKS